MDMESRRPRQEIGGKTECRSGLQRLGHEGGPGSGANYARHAEEAVPLATFY